MTQLTHFAVAAICLAGTAQASWKVSSWYPDFSCEEDDGGKYVTRAACCDSNPQKDPHVGDGITKSMGCGSMKVYYAGTDEIDYTPESWDNTPINQVVCHVVDQYYIIPIDLLNDEPHKSCKIAYGDDCRNQPAWDSYGACCSNSKPVNPYDIYDDIDGAVATPYVCSDYDCTMEHLPGNKDEACQDESVYESVYMTDCHDGAIEKYDHDGEWYQGGYFVHQYVMTREFTVYPADYNQASYIHTQIIKVSDSESPRIGLNPLPAGLVSEEDVWFRWETHGTGEVTNYAIDAGGCSEVSWPTPSEGEFAWDNCQDFPSEITEEFGDCERSVGEDGELYTWYCKHSYYTSDNAGNLGEYTYYMVKANCSLAESNKQYRKRAVFESE